MEGKVFINTAEARNEVVLPSANSSFSKVATMRTRDDELVINVFFLEVRFELGGAFVIQATVDGAKASLSKSLVHFFESGFDAMGGSVFEWDGKDVVAVVIVADKLIVVTLA